MVVVEVFTGLFLLIVLLTRWWLTRKLSLFALAALCAIGCSLWFALRSLRA